MTVEDMALTFVPKLGVRGAVHLLRCFGSAAAIYSASEDELRSRAELRADIARDIPWLRRTTPIRLCCARLTTTPP